MKNDKKLQNESCAEFLEFVSNRVKELRMSKNVSARKMSLLIGQHCGYITKLETQKFSPSVICFLKICNYFEISPEEFFNGCT